MAQREEGEGGGLRCAGKGRRERESGSEKEGVRAAQEGRGSGQAGWMGGLAE